MDIYPEEKGWIFIGIYAAGVGLLLLLVGEWVV
jgi:hypothetical protein